jgi:phosphohistidine phosphatase
MKKLLLVRHAKAAHEDSVKDFERPLKTSGVQDATIMAQRLHSHGIIPQHIVSSPALRTISTANIIAEHLGTYAIETNEQIYDSGEGVLFKIITQFSDEHDFVALVGHNPGISEVLYYLTGKVKDVATGTVALIDFEIDTWSEVSGKAGNLFYYDEP